MEIEDAINCLCKIEYPNEEELKKLLSFIQTQQEEIERLKNVESLLRMANTDFEEEIERLKKELLQKDRYIKVIESDIRVEEDKKKIK